VLVTLGTESVAEHFADLPEELRELVTEAVCRAPSTESEWNEFRIVGSYCGREKTAEEIAADAGSEVSRYQTGVESVREFLYGIA